jgi:hypothetical protein
MMVPVFPGLNHQLRLPTMSLNRTRWPTLKMGQIFHSGIAKIVFGLLDH